LKCHFAETVKSDSELKKNAGPMNHGASRRTQSISLGLRRKPAAGFFVFALFAAALACRDFSPFPALACVSCVNGMTE
jgi:hypothetical protein